MNKQNAIDVFNTLIIINNDRIEGYETASKETEQVELKNLFSHFTHTSYECKAELVKQVLAMGGTPDEGTRTTGKFFRVWMDVKAALTGHDQKYILDSCEYGEQVAQDTYEKALENNLQDISPEQQKMLIAQRMALKADHDNIISMQNGALGAY
jgi:uncharacterized protein (TIGR02284 family)